MRRAFTLAYWIDDGWYVGRLREVPGVFSQGESLEELEANIQDAYELMRGDEGTRLPSGSQLKEVELEVGTGGSSSGNWSGPDAFSCGLAASMTCTGIPLTEGRPQCLVIEKSETVCATCSAGN